jgi:hypothetical protein
LFDVTLTDKDGELEMSIKINDKAAKEAKKLDGKYVIATDCHLNPNQILTFFNGIVVKNASPF